MCSVVNDHKEKLENANTQGRIFLRTREKKGVFILFVFIPSLFRLVSQTNF